MVFKEGLPVGQLEQDAPRRPHIDWIRKSLEAHDDFRSPVIDIQLYFNALFLLDLARQTQI